MSAYKIENNNVIKVTDGIIPEKLHPDIINQMYSIYDIVVAVNVDTLMEWAQEYCQLVNSAEGTMSQIVELSNQKYHETVNRYTVRFLRCDLTT